MAMQPGFRPINRLPTTAVNRTGGGIQTLGAPQPQFGLGGFEQAQRAGLGAGIDAIQQGQGQALQTLQQGQNLAQGQIQQGLGTLLGGAQGGLSQIQQGQFGAQNQLQQAGQQGQQFLQQGQGQIQQGLAGSLNQLAQGGQQGQQFLQQGLGGALNQLGQAGIGAQNQLQQGVGAFQQGQQQGLGAINTAIDQGASGLNPFINPGQQAQQQQAALSGALGPEAQAAAQQAFTESPQQQFAREQGELARVNAATATGEVGSGELLKELTRFGIGTALQNQQQQFQNLGAVTGTGLQAAGQVGQLRGQQAGLSSNLIGNTAAGNIRRITSA